jgi:phosphoribosylaminoimidazolecarboxamide formyltransferase/IMP cyclohydrolase
MVRASAKNFADVFVVSSPEASHKVAQMLEGKSSVDEAQLRRELAAETFRNTTAYDSAISSYLGQSGPGEAPQPYEPLLQLSFEKIQDLRYGENPHQSAAFYRDPSSAEKTCVAGARQLHGKELSYNNIVDLDSALEVVRLFEEPACCVIKHNNPCGVARAPRLLDAYTAARDCDPVSAFGGVIGVIRELDAQTASTMAEMFVEAIIAPSFAPEALEVLQKKKNIRLLATGPFTAPAAQRMLKSVVGGLLVQTRDLGMVKREDLRVASKLKPTEEDLEALLFAWRVAKLVKSNAIVYTSRDATIGIGAGQMSRIDSTSLAAVKARQPIRGAYMASDAFFPFRDNVDRAADVGIKAIIEPGGSVRDEEVITAADEHEMILVFTGMRHFRH